MKKYILIFIFFSILAVIVTWPLILHLTTRILDLNDGLLITWIINWDVHSFLGGVSGIRNIFNANIFYPYSNNLAFSDYHLLNALVALPFVALFKEPLLAFNINFFAGIILTGFSLYLLVESLTHSSRTALFIATLFTLSPLHFEYAVHLQLFDLWPLILCLYFLFSKHYFWYIVLIVSCALNSPLLLFFLALFLTIYWRYIGRDGKKVLAASATGYIVSGIFLLPFFLVSRTFHYVRPITDAINFSLQIPQLFNIGPASRLSAIVPHLTEGTNAFFGIVFVLSGIKILFEYMRKKTLIENSDRKLFNLFLIVGLSSFVLALGPALHIYTNTVHVGPFRAIPLPYTLFYYLIPGFSGFRTPSRWVLFTTLCLTLAFSFFLKKRLTWKWTGFLIILCVLELNFPFNYQSVPDRATFPLEQKWLSNNYQGAPVIQFPIYNWSDIPQVTLETVREYYSTIHYHPMFNGFSGFSPVEWQNEVFWLQKNFPSVVSINFLHQKGIKLILTPHSWADKLSGFQNLRLVQSFPETNIYEIN